MIRPINNDATLNCMFKYLPEGATKKLAHFDGRRRITVYRGDDYMNKITEILDVDHPLTFIRNMKNLGTKDNPILKTATTVLRGVEDQVDVMLKKWGDSTKGLRVMVYDRFHIEPQITREYDNFEHLRQDKHMTRLFEKITGKKVL